MARSSRPLVFKYIELHGRARSATARPRTTQRCRGHRRRRSACTTSRGAVARRRVAVTHAGTLALTASPPSHGIELMRAACSSAVACAAAWTAFSAASGNARRRLTSLASRSLSGRRSWPVRTLGPLPVASQPGLTPKISAASWLCDADNALVSPISALETALWETLRALANWDLVSPDVRNASASRSAYLDMAVHRCAVSTTFASVRCERSIR